MSDTRKCPYCGGEIKAIAKKCKHCGKWLDVSYVPQEDVSKPLSKTNVSTPQVESHVHISKGQNNDVINTHEATPHKTFGKKQMSYIVAGILAVLVILVLIILTPNGSPKKISDFESGLILQNKGDSIAAAIASADYIDGGTALSKSGREQRAKELMNERYSKALSDKARTLITNERFNEVYMEYYVNYDGYKMGSPELRFKSVWNDVPQLDAVVEEVAIAPVVERPQIDLGNWKEESNTLVSPRFKNEYDPITVQIILEKDKMTFRFNTKIEKEYEMKVLKDGQPDITLSGKVAGKDFIITNKYVIDNAMSYIKNGSCTIQYMFLESGASHWGWFDFKIGDKLTNIQKVYSTLE